MDRPSQKRGDHAGDHVIRRIGDGRVGYCGLCGKVVLIGVGKKGVLTEPAILSPIPDFTG